MHKLKCRIKLEISDLEYLGGFNKIQDFIAMMSDIVFDSEQLK